ncbi:MAG: 4-hydroxybenzoyl-CoA reductase subunit beta [Planctomycetes bacterium]|jgi:4-hydroxybenzoyl-CoA reductase subunit beta|nr:4-hydroxybenzoyl-CoA reductase subunit beta [Planctomycetota bacterium]
MLRLPKFQVAAPDSVAEAVALLEQHGEDALVIAGGTDLVPNMKHELFTPELVVSLANIRKLRGIKQAEEGGLTIGAMSTLSDVAASEQVRDGAPALAQAASLVAGPQLRQMGTLGGNVMLDTRCQWYNQTYFWRDALGFCLKKDGTLCHVVAGGNKCVAAASNDTAPALMTLAATLVFEGTGGQREIPIHELFLADGIYNKKVRGEILTAVRIPALAPGHRGAYGKLRERGSIDFPLFGVAARLDVAADETVAYASLAAVALQARPVLLKRSAESLLGLRPGTRDFERGVDEAAELAYRQCRPLDNVPGDSDWRHEMVPVYVRRTLLAALEGSGPVHHV